MPTKNKLCNNKYPLVDLTLLN